MPAKHDLKPMKAKASPSAPFQLLFPAQPPPSQLPLPPPAYLQILLRILPADVMRRAFDNAIACATVYRTAIPNLDRTAKSWLRTDVT